MRPTHEYPAVVLLVIAFIVLSVSSASRKSATIDEFAHLSAGLYAWKTRDFSLYEKTPPAGRMVATLPALLMGPAIETDLARFSRNSWLPWSYGADFLKNNFGDYGKLLMAGRVMVVMVGALICVIVWRTSRKWYGPVGGLISLFICALSPTLIAHSRLVTTDVMAALMTLLFVLSIVAYLERPSVLRAALIAVALGGGVVVKFTCLFWAPFALAAPVLVYWLEYRARKGAPTVEGDRPRVSALAGHMAMIVFVVWVAVVAGYLGKGIGFNGDLKFSSSSMKVLAPVVGIVPLPRDFVSGLDKQMKDAEGGEWSEGNYLMGEWYGGNKWHYYPLALLVKTPVPYLLLFIFSAWFIVGRGQRPGREVELLFMAFAYFIFASLFGSLQIGVRYLLPVYPLCFILMGKAGPVALSSFDEDGETESSVMPLKDRQKSTMKLVLVLLGIWLLIDHIMIQPNYLAYFNSFAAGPRNGHKVLLDSNLDWGQDLPGLARWMEEEKVGSVDLAYFGHDDPARFGIDYDLPGRGSGNRFIAISVTFLMGKKYPMTFTEAGITKSDPMWETVARFRGRKPVETIGYSIYIFDKDL